MKAGLRPPLAPRRPHSLVNHGDERIDDWYWLHDRDNAEVIAYVEAENAYTKAVLSHTEPLQEKLFSEIKARIKETDESVPWRMGDWWYLSKTVEGLQYPSHYRRRGSVDASDELVLDANALANGHDYFELGALEVSPDGWLLAYSTDTEGDERYTMHARDLRTDEDLPDEIVGIGSGAAWADDNATIFYRTLDDAHRPFQVWRHRLGTDRSADVLVYQEDDERFHLSIDRTRSGRFVIINADSAITSEARFVPTADPGAEPVVIEPRRQGVEYSVDHHGDRFFIVTNDDALDFRLVEAPVDAPGHANWTDVIPARDDARLLGVAAFADHLAVYERSGGLRRVRVMRLADGDIHEISQPEAISTAGGQINEEFETTTLRYSYTSLVTPQSVFDYDMNARTRELKKQEPVLCGFDPTLYATERRWATAVDGASVPISMVRRKDTTLDGTAPCLLYGYGSYESSIDPRFSSARLSLLDRGFVFAIAHVRGGGEMGRLWYENGKFLNKPNTFSDFITCAEALIAEGVTSRDRLVIRGGSAGGLLVGASLNLRPDLFVAVVAEVPFVDCLTTILDESLPLTAVEWEEWGNPKQREFYDCMKSYAPYDNVRATNYPRMLVTAGLNDPRVSYFEPAKWVAKLRVTKSDDNLLVLKTEMGAGHHGPSGRYDVWKDEAFVYAFILDSLGITS